MRALFSLSWLGKNGKGMKSQTKKVKWKFWKNLFKAKLSVSHDGDDKDDDDDDNFLSEFKDVRSEHPNKIFFIHLMLIIYQKKTWIG